jgi:hypothetical protein
MLCACVCDKRCVRPIELVACWCDASLGQATNLRVRAARNRASVVAACQVQLFELSIQTNQVCRGLHRRPRRRRSCAALPWPAVCPGHREYYTHALLDGLPHRLSERSDERVPQSSKAGRDRTGTARYGWRDTVTDFPSHSAVYVAA